MKTEDLNHDDLGSGWTDIPEGGRGALPSRDKFVYRQNKEGDTVGKFSPSNPDRHNKLTKRKGWFNLRQFLVCVSHEKKLRTKFPLWNR